VNWSPRAISTHHGSKTLVFDGKFNIKNAYFRSRGPSHLWTTCVIEHLVPLYNLKCIICLLESLYHLDTPASQEKVRHSHVYIDFWRPSMSSSGVGKTLRHNLVNDHHTFLSFLWD
jgi:hypothetical protein